MGLICFPSSGLVSVARAKATGDAMLCYGISWVASALPVIHLSPRLASLSFPPSCTKMRRAKHKTLEIIPNYDPVRGHGALCDAERCAQVGPEKGHE